MMGRVLVAGATGHVGSQVVKSLLRKGRPVRALIRQSGAVVHGAKGLGDLDYAVGDLADRDSLRKALVGITFVVSTANSIIPVGKTMRADAISRNGARMLIEESERAGIAHFVQSSIPVHPLQGMVPEMAGKRALEDRLVQSSIPSTIIRNPVFMDVWLVITGSVNLMGPDPHATTRRPFGFMRLWQRLTGHLVARRGILLAPGGATKGAPFIATRDVAEMLAASVGHKELFNQIIEAGGPEWLTWADVAEKLSRKTKRPVHPVPLPAWFAAAGQKLLTPIMPSAGNVLGLVRYLATDQPRWEAPDIVRRLNLPDQITLDQYVDENWRTD